MGEVKTRGRCRTPHLELARTTVGFAGALDSCNKRTKNPAATTWVNEYSRGQSFRRFVELEESRAICGRGEMVYS